MKLKSLRLKRKCEVCEINDVMLHYHHIIPQCDLRCTNTNNNIAILCPNCHTKIHTGDLIIIGVYKSTENYSVIWYKNGQEPPMPKEFWAVKSNPLIKTLNGKQND